MMAIYFAQSMPIPSGIGQIQPQEKHVIFLPNSLESIVYNSHVVRAQAKKKSTKR